LKLDCIFKIGEREKRKIINCPKTDTVRKCLEKITDTEIYDKIECREII